MVLNPVISKLAGKLVVLASASPRRLEILSNVVRCPLVKHLGTVCDIYIYIYISTNAHFIVPKCLANASTVREHVM